MTTAHPTPIAIFAESVPDTWEFDEKALFRDFHKALSLTLGSGYRVLDCIQIDRNGDYLDIGTDIECAGSAETPDLVIDFRLTLCRNDKPYASARLIDRDTGEEYAAADCIRLEGPIALDKLRITR